VRADIPPGEITERDLIAVSPFENQMVLVTMTGAFLKTLLEDKLAGSAGGIYISGGKVRYDLARPDGDRILEFTIGDAPYEPGKVYKVAMTNYLAEGNSGLWRIRDELPRDNILFTGYRDLDCLREYIRKKGTIEARNDGRWVKVSS
jgi:5'-nucleotidase